MRKTIRVALVGNPNSGKSSLFNALTGLRVKVGNFPGVTVDKKSGTADLPDGVQAEFIDLPGTYSLYPRRMDEWITFDVLLNKANEMSPDAVVVLIDASNLKRNLLFCSQVLDLGLPTVVAMNMLDIAKKHKMTIDTEKLSAELGVPVVNVNGRDGSGITSLKKAIVKSLTISQSPFITVRDMAIGVIDAVKNITNTKSDYTALQIANHYGNIFCFNASQKLKIKNALAENNFSIGKTQGEDIVRRYGRISEILESCVKEDQTDRILLERTSKIDKVLTHPAWGYLIFLGILFIVFQAIFSWAQYPMDWISTGFSYVENLLQQQLPNNFFTRLITQGVLSGIGGVIIFVPQIMLLFGFVSILEDTGYMARITFLMDALMRRVGLSGKSSVPLMSGLACAIPAIMSTRGIENWKDRLITIMVTPLMSCSARLPVYTLLIAFAVPDTHILMFNLRGFVMMGLYLLGFVMAILAAFVMKLFVRITEKSYFIMEMPIYRMPRWKNVITTMIQKAGVFVTDAGKVIVVISIILWFLASYGPSSKMNAVDNKYQTLQTSKLKLSPQLQQQHQSELLQNSYAGIIGRVIEPVIRPLGFDWKIGIALITSFAAREVFVGTMATIYSVGGSNESNFNQIRQRMRTDINPNTGKPIFTGLSAISLMVFFALAMQCMSTLAVVRRETKSWKWPVIQLIYMSGLAYFCSFFVYQVFK